MDNNEEYKTIRKLFGIVSFLLFVNNWGSNENWIMKKGEK